MKNFVGFIVVFLFVTNLFSREFITNDNYRYHPSGHYSGYLRDGETKRFRFVIPQGYKAKVTFKSSKNNGVTEVKMYELRYTGVNMTEDMMHLLPDNFINYKQGMCDSHKPYYIRLEQNIYGKNCHYDLDINYIPMSQCTKVVPDVIDDHILHLNKIKSNSMNKHDIHRYKLEHPVEGVVTVKLDNLTNDLDLYTGIEKGGIGVAMLHKKWDCRPWYAGKSSEECTTIMKKSDYLEVVVDGYSKGSYNLTATLAELKPLSVGSLDNSYVGYRKWRYYKVLNPNGIKKLIARLENLRSDIDLYIRKGKLPTYKKYDCRSWNSGSRNEECKITISSSKDTIYIGVRGYKSGSYTLSLNEEPHKRATILLHGLASSSETWNELISSKFRGKCTRIIGGRMTSSIKPFGSNEYCFKVDFGAYDGSSGLKDILGKRCTKTDGCRGDYSTFDTLGKEVQDAVKSVVQRLGNDVDITLVGHSRGGLAATAYVGKRAGSGIGNVKAVLTTGTPFLGSPLGKINSYMKKFCLPYNAKKNDTRYCKKDWEARRFIRDVQGFNSGLDVVVPSVSFLQPNSTELNKIFSSDRIESLQRGLIDYISLVYKGENLGNLAHLGGTVYNPFPNVNGLIDYIPSGFIPPSFLQNISTEFSDRTEKYILGYGDVTQKAKLLHGDGIVPYKNQDIASLENLKVESSYIITGYDYFGPIISPSSDINKIVSFNRQNRVVKEFSRNIVHIQEPKEVNDISRELDNLWMRQSRHMIHSLLPANEFQTILRR